ncbi:MAG: hypothetical protein J6333_01365, partial [Planctomycetes bacterium]|nr:hypothetical protein [Planctomycetota bacterium]
AKAAAALPGGTAKIPQCNTDAPVVAAEGVGRLNFYQAYEGARGLEKQIIASFRDIRAAELSMLRELAMPQALRNVEVPAPARMRLPSPEAVLRRPRTEAGLEEQKLLIRASLEEADKMIANCNDLLQQLRKDDGADNVALESDDAPETFPMSEAELVALLNEEAKKQREDAREKVAEVAKQAEAVQKMAEEKKRDNVREETAKAAEAARQTVAELQKQVEKMEQAKTVEEVEKAVKEVEALVKKLETVRDEERKAKEKEKNKHDAESKEFAKEAQKAADLAEDAMVVVQDLADSVRQMAEKAQTPPPADAVAADPAAMLASLKDLLKAQAEPFRPQLQLVAEKTEVALKDEQSERPETEQADRLADQALADMEKELQKLEKAESLPEVAEAAKKMEEIAKATEEVAKLEDAAAKKSADKKHQEAERKEKDAAAAAQASAQDIQKKMAQAQQQIATAQQMAGKASPSGKAEARLAQAKAFERAAAETTAQVADISALMKQANVKDLTKAANNLVRVGTAYPKLTAETPGLAWGRKIVGGAGAVGYQPSSWMVLGSWYVIGPWPNPNRVNRDRKLPPENIVDLDATYQGMNGETLKWEYRTLKVDEPWKGAKDCPAMVSPPKAAEYAIYYFFTEVHCDAERDLWFATTSDDKSKVWINDMLVWESGGELKSARFGEEGYRKVHLQAGNNRILYRLENGWHGTSFSMCFFINNPAR